MIALAAGLAACLAALLAAPVGGHLLARRLGAPAAAGPSPGGRSRGGPSRGGRPRMLARRHWPRSALVLLGAGGFGAALAAVRAGEVVPLLGAATTGWLVRAVAVQRRRERRAVRRHAALVEVVDAFAAEVRAGRAPTAALARAAPLGGTAASEVLTAATRAAAMQGDVPAALRGAAGTPGAEALAHLAACWEVAERQGAGLAAALGRLSVALRAEAAHRRAVAVHLASARATARLVAGLPIFALLLGTGLGARPWDVLLFTGWGRACAATAAALIACGLWWTDRIAAGAGGAAGGTGGAAAGGRGIAPGPS